MYKIVFVRHGESLWNKEGLFTGWVDAEVEKKGLTDVDITKRGIKEAITAGTTLKDRGFEFDLAYTSYLERSIKTLDIILDQMNLMWIPVIKSWKLNERHYGDLQGLNKKEMAKKFGEDKVFMWRRGYTVRPPKVKKSNKYYTKKDPKYKNIPNKDLPLAESLEDVVKRVEPYWKKEICKQIKTGKKIIIAGHGNSLRAIIKYLDKIPDNDIPFMNIPTGVPIVYELNKKLQPIKHYYLADKETVAKLEARIRKQGKL